MTGSQPRRVRSAEELGEVVATFGDHLEGADLAVLEGDDIALPHGHLAAVALDRAASRMATTECSGERGVVDQAHDQPAGLVYPVLLNAHVLTEVGHALLLSGYLGEQLLTVELLQSRAEIGGEGLRRECFELLQVALDEGVGEALVAVELFRTHNHSLVYGTPPGASMYCIRFL